jgi:hypothetical protein
MNGPQGGFSRITNRGMTLCPLMGHIQGFFQSLVNSITEERQYMPRAIAGPFDQLMVLFFFQGSAPMFRNKPFIPHFFLFRGLLFI